MYCTVYYVFQEVNGGVLNIAEGGYARFREEVSMTRVSVRSETDEGSDISPDTWSGGCIHNSVRTPLQNHVSHSNTLSHAAVRRVM